MHLEGKEEKKKKKRSQLLDILRLHGSMKACVLWISQHFIMNFVRNE